MKFRPNKKYIHMGIILLAVTICSLCFYYLLFHSSQFGIGMKALSEIAMPIIYGFIFAYLLTPVVNKIEVQVLQPLLQKCKIEMTVKRKKLLRGTSIIITIAIVLLTLYGFFSLVIPHLLESIRSISIQFPLFMFTINRWVINFGADNPDVMKFIMDNIAKYSVEIQAYLNTNIIPQMENLVKSVSLSLLGLFQALWNLLIGIIISCYVLYNKELFAGQVKKIIFALFKTKFANTVIRNIRFVSKTFIGFIGGKIIDSIIIGFLCFFGTSLMNTPYAVLISVIVGITNVIPFFGPYLGAIPSAFLILMVNPLQCFYFLIFILILQQFDGNFLGPRILGESTGLSGFWVIFSITIFGGIFGIPGMIVGVPFFAVLYAGVKGYVNKKLSLKGLSQDTTDYLDVGSIEDQVFIKYLPEKKKARSLFTGKIKENLPSHTKTEEFLRDKSESETSSMVSNENKQREETDKEEPRTKTTKS